MIEHPRDPSGNLFADGCTSHRTEPRHPRPLCPPVARLPVSRVPRRQFRLYRPIPARSPYRTGTHQVDATKPVHRPVRPAGDVSPYAEPAYRSARAHLVRFGAMCWKHCGRPATTIDHVPAIARHNHIAGTGCCELLPACAPCNMGAGARIGNQSRTRQRPYASRRW